MLRPDRAFGTAGAPGAGSPYFGAKLLIADRGNNRLLSMDAAMHVVWRYPAPGLPRDPLRFYFPDDAFFTDHGTAIISNQEQNETIIKLAYPSGKIIWSFGHPGHSGTAPGYLNEPDDAYLLRDGQVTVADAQNCRVLVINANRTVAHQIGTDGVCAHHPPASMGSPNGDTPLADGNLLVSEINGSWVSEYTPAGKLVWTVRLPISYPSDPQQLGPDRYLIADYADPGQILEFDRAGHISYRYRAPSGPGMLNHPSLTELLPSGVFMANDDYNDRMVAVDPGTNVQLGVAARSRSSSCSDAMLTYVSLCPVTYSLVTNTGRHNAQAVRTAPSVRRRSCHGPRGDRRVHKLHILVHWRPCRRHRLRAAGRRHRRRHPQHLRRHDRLPLSRRRTGHRCVADRA